VGNDSGVIRSFGKGCHWQWRESGGDGSPPPSGGRKSSVEYRGEVPGREYDCVVHSLRVSSISLTNWNPFHIKDCLSII